MSEVTLVMSADRGVADAEDPADERVGDCRVMVEAEDRACMVTLLAKARGGGELVVGPETIDEFLLQELSELRPRNSAGRREGSRHEN
jgi:hypothetical protein